MLLPLTHILKYKSVHISLNDDFNLILSEKGKISSDIFKIKMAFWDIEKKIDGIHFRFLSISWKRKLQEEAHFQKWFKILKNEI